MRILFLVLSFGCVIASFCNCGDNRAVEKNNLRAPAYPLITINPYTSDWLFGNELYGSPVRHWTGKSFPLVGANALYFYLWKYEP